MSQGNIFGFGFFGNLIRRMLKDNPPFYPLFANFFLNRKLPILVDTNNLMFVYLSIPHLRMAIEKKAEMFKNMKIEIYRTKADGTEEIINDHPLLQLLEQPNPLQGFQDFASQYSIYKDIYANAFIYKLKPWKSAAPKVLWNLPPAEMKIIPTGKIFEQSKLEDIIEYYQMYLNGQGEPINYDPNQIMHAYTGTSDKYIFGESKILTNKMAISNIDGALKTRNIIINEKGAIGILSNNSKDSSGGGTPLDQKERERISKDYQSKYGLADEQMRIVMTNSNLKWQPMSYPTKDLMLFEEVEEDFCTLLGAFGLSRDLFPNAVQKPTLNDSGGSLVQALRQTYQNTIQQEADTFLNMFKKDSDFAFEKDLKIRASYRHLPAMQENELERAQVEKEAGAGSAQIITSVIALNQAVQAGTMTQDGAVNLLVATYEDIDMTAAKKIIGPKIEKEPLPTPVPVPVPQPQQ